MTDTLSYYETNFNALIDRYESANVSEVQKLLLQIHKTLPDDLQFKQKFDVFLFSLLLSSFRFPKVIPLGILYAKLFYCVVDLFRAYKFRYKL